MLRRARVRAYGCGLAAAAALAAAALPSYAGTGPVTAKLRLGPNLLPNPSFEQSPTDPVGDAAAQPLLPTGWAFEGATGLFDHNQHGAHTGKRAAGISDPMTLPAQVCQQKQCAADPAAAAATNARTYYSEMPAWRNQSAVPVKPGRTYQLSAWVTWTLQTVKTGAVTAVRWVDASGSPVALGAGPAKLADTHTSGTLGWTRITALLKAPAGAAGAVVLLGDSDGGWISSLKYDDVYFGQLGR
jgi:hypothetical protein